MRKSLLVAALAASTLGLAGCSGYQAPNNAFHSILQEPYTLDSGDVINISVFEQAELTRTYSVDKAGYIAFPLVGSVAARGSTVKQLEARLAAKLRNGFLRDPDVSAEVSQYRPFYIMGQVGRSGQYRYVPGMTVQNAIASAGGFNSRAMQQNVDITRSINGKVMTGRVRITDPIMPGDTIYIRERIF
jgi:polysaccharide export outer membrane protein